MFARTSGLLGVAAVLGTASASLVTFEARDVTPISTLVARQTSGFDPSIIPSQCQSDCSAVVNDISTCQTATDPLCGCSTRVAGDMRTCFSCLVNLAPSAQSSIQSSYDEYITGCNSAGANLPSGSIGSGPSSGGSGTSVPGSRVTTTGANKPTNTGSSSSNSGGSGNNGNTGNSGSSNAGPPGVAASGSNGALSTRGNVALASVLSASFCAILFL